MGNSTFARTEIFWLEVFQLGEFFPNWGPLAPGAFLVCHLGSWSLSCLPRDTKARGLETLAYAVRLALPKSWELISTLISMPGSARRLGQRQACWGAVTLGRLPWADLSDRAALSPGCSHCCCAELLLSETVPLISLDSGTLGSVFWKCFGISEVAFLGISSLWAFSEEFLSYLIWSNATSSDKTTFPANWRLGSPGSSTTCAPSALVLRWIRFCCPNSSDSAILWPVRL